MPLDLAPDQVMDYLFQIKSSGAKSASFFNFTVHGMRYACKMRGLEYTQFSLPTLKGPRKIPGRYLFENKSGEVMTEAGIRWIVKQAAKKAGITKDIHTYTLSYPNFYKIQTSLN